MEKSERVAWIDCAKAFAIALVVLGHIAEILKESPYDIIGILEYFIYCFHMPFFFILSGLSYKMSRQAQITDRKTKVKYSIIHCFDFAWIVVLFNILSDLPLILTSEYQNIGLIDLMIKWASNHWYIVVLSLIYLIIPWIKQVNVLVLIVWLIITLLCGLVYMPLAKFILYFFCFLLGNYLHEFDKIKYGVWFGVFFLIAATIWYFLSNGALLNDVYSKTVLGLSGSLFFINYFMTAPDRTKHNWILKTGQNTLIIYLTHGWIIGWKGWSLISDSIPLAICFLGVCFSVCVMMGIFIMLLEKFPLVKSILLKPSLIQKQLLRKTTQNSTKCE